MAGEIKTPFTNAIEPKASFSEKDKLGTDPTAKPSDSGIGKVTPIDLPFNSLKFGEGK